MAARRNCWDVMRCGRGPEGAMVAEQGVCPAATDVSVHGVNGGTNGGRLCWAVAGTLCGGSREGTFAHKELTCYACRFFREVQMEEGDRFAMSRPEATSLVPSSPRTIDPSR